MCIIEAATNQLPWGTDRSDMLVNVKVKVKGLIPPKPSMLTKHQWHLVRRMCAKDPAARPDIQKVTHQLRCFAAVENEVIKQHNICRSDEYCLQAQEMVFMQFNKLYGAELESNDIDSLNSYGSDDINECETVEHITKMAALQVLDSQWKTRVQDPQQEISDSFADLQLGDAEDCEISVHPWRINPKDLTWGTEIGTGGFGKVFSGTWLSAAVAIKEFKKTTEADLEMFRRELDIWYLLNHPHIVNLFGAGDEDKYYFICDLANSKSKGNLSRCGSNFEKKHVWKLLYQTASALQHLHSRGIVHGDVKGNNVLIKGDDQAQLTDFGLSFRQTGMTNNSTAPTTAAVRWKAPECFTKTGSSSISPTPASNREATAMSDVYALGMCILEAVSGRFPWGFIPDLAVEHHVRNGEIPQQPSCFTNTEWELVKRMCRFEKEKRLQLPIVVKLLGIFAFDNVAHVADRLFLSKMVSDSAQAKLEVRPQRGLEFPIGANFHTAGNLLAA
ncbi:hypothetical protein PF005_g23810 [Phytophthora fragariae]|uniref:Protein kinase domain-containing protein n=1 Tax=Phytophthora fragariae TaxID=53985 RepID=A0A6A3WZ45_9STRA|nr:hypothetical protein PF009_g24420 [Phytophthora fragariae]KAE9078892.1 hypothetical protein PF007_g23668 [Phytophthora fragariae]KAE9099333.1 hypothetical protein PF006_g23161 [Phytophthora fragariae]KAE9179102.1 hypothetical protein PF005_g23810 [Phytophthora fragariae]KAE9190209.1 hypothetical protein PF002_g24829 [Phytophthora fragariae]